MDATDVDDTPPPHAPAELVAAILALLAAGEADAAGELAGLGGE